MSPPGASVPYLSATKAIRVVVTVYWNEGGRSREVRLGTVRM